ncbi:MAG: zinc ribbon domain-containing protein [Evtepia gabavorous]
MLVQGKHTPLIEESVFQAAGIRLDAQVARSSKHARPWGERKHWLAGLARCGACGSGLVFSKPHYLKCGRYTKGKCSVSQHIVAETLEAAVLSRMRLDAAGKHGFLCNQWYLTPSASRRL